MSTKIKGQDNSDVIQPVKHKGQPHEHDQKGSAGVSKKKTEKHFRDESHGAARNVEKKQQNSI